MILLCAVNATYQYPSLGLRSLLANLGELRERTELAEFSIKLEPAQIAAELLARRPQVVGFGVYIWNVNHILEICRRLKSQLPELHIVVGGPEVSYEWETSPLQDYADVVVQGEGEEVFAKHCHQFLSGEWQRNTEPTLIRAPLVELSRLSFPYQYYSDHDLRTRHICVEASRGCPFKCQFCLSSLDVQVRKFPLEEFCHELRQLLARGARNFKFIDRTFNLSPATCETILQLFLPWKEQGLFLHFEMVPDRLPQLVKDLVCEFPPNTIQFEVGIQTLNQEVAQRIERFNRWELVRENLKFLSHQSPVHIHADLIAGLPGEDLDSFARGFDQLLALGPHEIQVGILKRLKGAPIAVHDREWEMVYSPTAPYQVQQTKNLSREDLQWIERFAKFWDRVYNSGCFREFLRLLWGEEQSEGRSPFRDFMNLVRFLTQYHPTTYRLQQLDLIQSLLRYLVEVVGVESSLAKQALASDYRRRIAPEVPHFLLDSELNGPRPSM